MKNNKSWEDIFGHTKCRFNSKKYQLTVEWHY